MAEREAEKMSWGTVQMDGEEDEESILKAGRRRVDDTVVYRIYVDDCQHAEPEAKRALLFARLVQYREFVAQWIDRYMWQRDPFRLDVCVVGSQEGAEYETCGDESCESHLCGATNFGDCIDDEWFIVFVLLHLSAQFKDTTIHVVDHDGQFILIEAALVIPKWMNANNSGNRVFLRGGSVHIVPLPNTPSLLYTVPVNISSPSMGVNVLRRGAVDTIAGVAVQEALKRRLQPYPDKIQESAHWVQCQLPLGAAHVLQRAPALVAPAVDAFYHRDPIDVKACNRMAVFPPTNTVTTMVRLTRTMYAQLQLQPFPPPKPFQAASQSVDTAKARDIGIKLACGLEIAYDHGRRMGLLEDTSGDLKDAAAYPFKADPRWAEYQRALTERGFYRGEMQGSAAWRERELQAQRYYFQHIVQAGSRGVAAAADKDANNGNKLSGVDLLSGAAFAAMRQQLHPAVVMHGLLKEPMEAASFPASALRDDDEETWLYLSAAGMDSMLADKQREFEAYDAMRETTDDNASDAKAPTREDVARVEKVVHGMRAFMGHSSDYTGAELPAETPGIGFDPERFLAFLSGATPDERSRPTAHGDDDNEGDDDLFGDFEPEEGDEEGEEMTMDEKAEMAEYMRRMDAELSAGLQQGAAGTSEGAADDEGQPIDLDLNMVRNFLESHAAQAGLAGPVSNLLGAMGLRLPDT